MLRALGSSRLAGGLVAIMLGLVVVLSVSATEARAASVMEQQASAASSSQSSEAADEEVYGATNSHADSDLPFWGDEHTEVDELDQHNELVLLEAGLDTSEAEAEADADAEADEDAEGNEAEDEDGDAADDEEGADADSDSDADAEETVAVEAESSYQSAASIASVAENEVTAAGMADRVSLVEHDTRMRHEVPLQASAWAALVAEARGYQSNVLRANAKTQVRGGPCAGVIGANCKHEADMQGGIGQAPQWQEECAKLICNPLCLRYTWDVKIVASGGPDGFEDAVNALGTQHSLGAQFRAHACAKVAGCCEENDDLLNWVELRNSAGMFPESPQPALACDLRANAGNEDQTPTKDELCSQCKEAITVEAEPKDGACDYFVKVPDPADMGDEVEVFARNGESAAAQIPKHKSFKEKCEAVQGLMAGIISGLASGEWKEKACSCLGCCEESPGSECYYPVVYGTTDEAHAAHKQ